jgi:hypothetical protein
VQSQVITDQQLTDAHTDACTAACTKNADSTHGTTADAHSDLDRLAAAIERLTPDERAQLAALLRNAAPTEWATKPGSDRPCLALKSGFSCARACLVGGWTRYLCETGRALYGTDRCQGVAARAIDDEVVRLALLALTPAALDVSLRVTADVEQQRTAADTRWRQRLEHARYETDRARRQFEAVEPEHRLVARTLE